ncbi:MAG TPA: efflux RND transporter permease subunit, partial [Candidatus Tyrphobacter sp.]
MITAMVFVALVVFGIIAYFQIGRGQNPPGVEFPLVFVAANYPGASPQDMEKLVIKPIEDQLQGLQDVEQVTANAQEGEAEVDVQFKIGTNLDLAAVDVQRRVDTARVFMPADLDPPVVGKAGSSDPLMTLAVSSSSLSPTQMADMVQNQVLPLIEQIPNVQTVTVRGAQTREFHVEPNPERLAGLNATLDDIFGAIAANNANLPGGRIDKPTQETTVSVRALINNASDLAAIPLAIPNVSMRALRIGDVAVASDSYADQRYISTYDNQPRVRIEIDKAITADEITSATVARQQLTQIEPQFPQLTFHEMVVPADYTRRSLNGVWQSLIEGIFLTAIVMLLFLHAWRNAVVVMVAIPTSIASTFVVMKMLGFTFDFMSLMALSLIIGILVDDSIVVLENITRHRDLGESPIDAAISGRTEIGGAAIAITLVDVIVFLPIAFLPGIVGKYLEEFALVIVIATLFSLFVSFTLTPLLAAFWSVRERPAAPPAWLGAFRSPASYIGAGIAAAVLWFVPWTYAHVISIILVALIALNAFVHNYDGILESYRSKFLPMALRHGYFVVFVCFTLLFNALFLLGGGMVSASLDFVLLTVLAVGLLLGFLFRRADMKPIEYVQHPESILRILGAHFAALTPASVAGQPRFAALRNAFRFLIRSAAGMYKNKRVTAATFALPLTLMLTLPWLGQISTDFVPSGQTGSIGMTLTYPPGTPIGTTSRYVNALSAAIMKVDGIESVNSTVGYIDTGWSSQDGGNYATLSAKTFDSRVNDTNKIIAKIRELAYLAPGGTFAVAGSDSGGSGAPIFYALQGPDAVLDATANKIVSFLRSTPGTVNVESSANVGAPRLNIDIDPARAALLGVSPGTAAEVARIAVGGALATRVRTPTGLVDVRLQLAASDRNNLDTIKGIRVRAADGTMVPLSAIATFSQTV